MSEADEVRRILNLRESDLDSRGNRDSGCGFEGVRGGLAYSEPGCDWLKDDGHEGEWAVGFTPLSPAASEQFNAVMSFQGFPEDTNVNPFSNENGSPCGEGTIFTDDIELVSQFADLDGSLEETLLIGKARLNPRKIHIPMCNPKYRIVPSKEYSRVYGVYILARNLRGSSAKSIGNNLYREKPTASEYKTSLNVENRLNNTSTVVKEGLPILKSACENIGAELIFTEKKGESDFEMLPTLLEKGKFEPKVAFTLKVTDNYDEVFHDDTDVINSSYVRKLKRNLAISANLEVGEIDIKSVTCGSVIVTGIAPRSIDAKSVEDRFPKYKVDVDSREIKAVLKLSEDDFDARGDNNQFTGTDGGGGIRGGMTYKQPGPEWKRIGLRVRGRYDNGNDDWLEMGGKPGEWAIGFHGPGSLAAARGITAQRSIKTDGPGQLCEDQIDTNPLSENKGNTCGKGAYFSENIETARSFAGRGTVGSEGRTLVFQARLNPCKTRVPVGYPDYRIVPTTQDSRIYGICILNRSHTS